MSASLIVIPWTILEISKFLWQLLVDKDDNDEKSQLNAGIASLALLGINAYTRGWNRESWGGVPA